MKDTDEIFEEMCAGIETRSGVTLSRSGDMALRLYAASAQLASLWVQADWIKMQCFPQTAVGEYLDYHAAMRSLSRSDAVCAEGNITFSTDEARSAELAVAAGTVCMNAAGTEFITTAAGTIAAGQTSCTVPARARNGGEGGNAAAGSVCYMAISPVGIVSCTNAEAFSGGADKESDAALRQRVLKSFAALPNGSNAAFYEQEALAESGVAAAKVLPRNRGIGTVDVVISGNGGVPSDELVSSLDAELSKQREICVDVEVSAPQTVSVDVTASVTAADGYDSAQVAAAVKTALTALFDGKMLGKSVLLAKLGSVIYGVEGVANYSIAAPATDVAITATQLPVAGTITVTGG